MPKNEDALVVVAALVESDGRLLLARRKREGSHGGLWELPGGKVEEGERPEEALVREIGEELGVGVELLGPARSYSSRLAGRSCRFVVIPARCASEPVSLNAHEEIAFFGPADLPWESLAPLDADALRDWQVGRFSPRPAQRLS